MVLGRLFAKRYLLIRWQCNVFKQRWITLRPLAAITVLSAAVVVRKGGCGQLHYGHWSGGQHHDVDQLLARDLPNMHGAHCVINPIDAKAWFPALNPGHLTLTPYVDIWRRSNLACWFLWQRSHTLRHRTSTDATCRTYRARLDFCGMSCCAAIRLHRLQRQFTAKWQKLFKVQKKETRHSCFHGCDTYYGQKWT